MIKNVIFDIGRVIVSFEPVQALYDELGDMEGIGKWLAGEERYFLQTFVDSGNLLGSGFEAFSHEETRGFLKAIRIYIPSAKLRGQEEGE